MSPSPVNYMTEGKLMIDTSSPWFWAFVVSGVIAAGLFVRALVFDAKLARKEQDIWKKYLK